MSKEILDVKPSVADGILRALLEAEFSWVKLPENIPEKHSAVLWVLFPVVF